MIKSEILQHKQDAADSQKRQAELLAEAAKEGNKAEEQIALAAIRERALEILMADTGSFVSRPKTEEKPTDNLDGYPVRDNFQKFGFILRQEKRVLQFKELIDLMAQREGTKSKTIVKHIKAQVVKLVNEGRIYKVKFGNSKRFTYYGIDRSWLDTTEKPPKLLNEYYPPPHIIANVARPDLVVITDNFKGQ